MVQTTAAGSEFFEASYTDRDVILYALSIGFGQSGETYGNDLKFLWESHPSFSVSPTFCLTLIFWARLNKQELASIPTFPPPLMAHTEVLPRRFLKDDVSIDYPVIHTYQSITWHSMLRAPKRGETLTTRLRQRVKTVSPKSVGTFVTTETTVYQAKNEPVCTMQSTMLVLGICKDLVIPCEANHRPKATDDILHSESEREIPVHEEQVVIDHNAALLYRLSSGDSNRIHVDPSSNPLLRPEAKTNPRVLLHGLCTLGIVARVLLQKFGVSSLQHFETEFKKPVFLGDRLVVRFFIRQAGKISFHVRNMESGDIVVLKGRGVLHVSQTSSIGVSNPVARL